LLELMIGSSYFRLWRQKKILPFLWVGLVNGDPHSGVCEVSCKLAVNKTWHIKARVRKLLPFGWIIMLRQAWLDFIDLEERKTWIDIWHAFQQPHISQHNLAALIKNKS
jgi:hypothetical protein